MCVCVRLPTALSELFKVGEDQKDQAQSALVVLCCFCVPYPAGKLFKVDLLVPYVSKEQIAVI